MDNYTFPYKKVLILENEDWKDDEETAFHYFYRKLKKSGVEFKIIDHAASKKKEDIVSAMLWCEALLFSSTFIYRYEVKGLGDLLMNIPIPKTVIGYVMGSRGDLEFYLTDIWELKELAKMSHHKVFELVNTHPQLGEPLSEIDMVKFKTKFDEEEAERIHRNHNMPKTGRKVLIKKIQAFGKQWSLLKEGDIVDELDCSSIDESPERGVWVMGLDEPVKLLNDDNYEEYEYDTLSSEALTLEFFSRGRAKNRKSQMETIHTWIHNCVGCQLDDSELWLKCDSICTLVGVERRGNRTYFERRLKEYREKYHYFKESAPDPREKYLRTSMK